MNLLVKIRHAKTRTVGTQRYSMSCLMDSNAAQVYLGSRRQADLLCVIVDVGRVELLHLYAYGLAGRHWRIESP